MKSSFVPLQSLTGTTFVATPPGLGHVLLQYSNQLYTIIGLRSAQYCSYIPALDNQVCTYLADSGLIGKTPYDKAVR